MSGALLYKMLKAKTKNPLHAAVRLRREDVVFLCLVENDGTVSQEFFLSIYFLFPSGDDFESSPDFHSFFFPSEFVVKNIEKKV
jgi:hypothetical protein